MNASRRLAPSRSLAKLQHFRLEEARQALGASLEREAAARNAEETARAWFAAEQALAVQISAAGMPQAWQSWLPRGRARVSAAERAAAEAAKAVASAQEALQEAKRALEATETLIARCEEDIRRNAARAEAQALQALMMRPR
ncbi:MAG: hypothetical protein IRZ23_01400 [Acetobacteraceae bacterium]|nr:hypothetical protein [Acetobacteraceae bacterium]